MRSVKPKAINLSKPLRDAARKVKRSILKIETVKPGLVFYDKRGLGFKVEKVIYKNKERNSSIHYPTLVILKSQKVKNIKQIVKKVTMQELSSQFKTFYTKHIIAEDENPTSAPLPISFYSANPVIKEKPSYLNKVFQDERPTRMSGIIEAIQEQIKKEAVQSERREGNLGMTYTAIQKHFNGFIAKNGWFSEKISDIIVFIDWIGEECKFSEYKETAVEKSSDYNVVIVYTKNKAKNLFINVLKRFILKYPKNGGK